MTYFLNLTTKNIFQTAKATTKLQNITLKLLCVLYKCIHIIVYTDADKDQRSRLGVIYQLLSNVLWQTFSLHIETINSATLTSREVQASACLCPSAVKSEVHPWLWCVYRSTQWRSHAVSTYSTFLKLVLTCWHKSFRSSQALFNKLSCYYFGKIPCLFNTEQAAVLFCFLSYFNSMGVHCSAHLQITWLT